MEKIDISKYQTFYQKKLIREINFILSSKGPVSKYRHKLSFFTFFHQKKNNIRELNKNGTDNNGKTIEQLINEGYYSDFLVLLDELKNL